MPRLSTLLLIAAISMSLSAGLAWLRAGDPGLPDFSQWPAGEARKARFFAYLRPLLEAENERILAQRGRLESIARNAGKGGIGFFDGRWLAELAREYAMDPGAAPPDELVDELLLRVDAVPVSLGLAQAAKESGWTAARPGRTGHRVRPGPDAGDLFGTAPGLRPGDPPAHPPQRAGTGGR